MSNSAPSEDAILRRAILDLLNAQGSSINDDIITLRLRNLGHMAARSMVRDNLQALAVWDYVSLEELGDYFVALITADGRDVSDGYVQVDGISRYKAVIL
jgi:hypothetical protein